MLPNILFLVYSALFTPVLKSAKAQNTFPNPYLHMRSDPLYRNRADDTEFSNNGPPYIEKFTDFFHKAMEILYKYEDTDLKAFFWVLRNELMKSNFKGCKFNEILDNNRFQRFIVNVAKKFEKMEPNEIRDDILKLLAKLQEERFGSHEKDLVESMNSVYTDESFGKLNSILIGLYNFGMAININLKSNILKLKDAIRDGVSTIILDYCNRISYKVSYALKTYIDDYEYNTDLLRQHNGTDKRVNQLSSSQHHTYKLKSQKIQKTEDNTNDSNLYFKSQAPEAYLKDGRRRMTFITLYPIFENITLPSSQMPLRKMANPQRHGFAILDGKELKKEKARFDTKKMKKVSMSRNIKITTNKNEKYNIYKHDAHANNNNEISETTKYMFKTVYADTTPKKKEMGSIIAVLGTTPNSHKTLNYNSVVFKSHTINTRSKKHRLKINTMKPNEPLLTNVVSSFKVETDKPLNISFRSRQSRISKNKSKLLEYRQSRELLKQDFFLRDESDSDKNLTNNVNNDELVHRDEILGASNTANDLILKRMQKLENELNYIISQIHKDDEITKGSERNMKEYTSYGNDPLVKMNQYSTPSTDISKYGKTYEKQIVNRYEYNNIRRSRPKDNTDNYSKLDLNDHVTLLDITQNLNNFDKKDNVNNKTRESQRTDYTDNDYKSYLNNQETLTEKKYNFDNNMSQNKRKFNKGKFNKGNSFSKFEISKEYLDEDTDKADYHMYRRKQYTPKQQQHLEYKKMSFPNKEHIMKIYNNSTKYQESEKNTKSSDLLKKFENYNSKVETSKKVIAQNIQTDSKYSHSFETNHENEKLNDSEEPIIHNSNEKNNTKQYYSQNASKLNGKRRFHISESDSMSYGEEDRHMDQQAYGMGNKVKQMQKKNDKFKENKENSPILKTSSENAKYNYGIQLDFNDGKGMIERVFANSFTNKDNNKNIRERSKNNVNSGMFSNNDIQLNYRKFMNHYVTDDILISEPNFEMKKPAVYIIPDKGTKAIIASRTPTTVNIRHHSAEFFPRTFKYMRSPSDDIDSVRTPSDYNEHLQRNGPTEKNNDYDSQIIKYSTRQESNENELRKRTHEESNESLLEGDVNDLVQSLERNVSHYNR